MNECKKEKRGGICFYNCDNIEFMKTKPDNFYDLAIVDPPYGLGDRLVKGGAKGGMGTLKNLADDKVEIWDKIPPPEYFTELQRVSKHQIIWGGNYFLDCLGKTDGFIVWDKMNGTNPMADAELAWQNIKGTTRMFRWHHFSGERNKKIHPTQKPIMLYRWLLTEYAKEGFKILDTHGGSHTHAIACDLEGFDLDIIEIDQKYFKDGLSAFDMHKRQLKLF